jgi:ABC-type polar amino acid transport system ATPase subunit
MLIAQNITKSYGKNKVLDNVSISVLPGKISLLIGPSGSGKTTLLKCLAFLENPELGKIQFDTHEFVYPHGNVNKDFKPWPEITVVFQQHFLWPHLTIRDNILLPYKARKLPIPDQFEQLVDLFEMDEFINRYPNQVSLGQRQRAALARALVLRPRYILLDEITSALDVEQVGKIITHLLEMRKQGIGILLITHQIGFAKNLLQAGEGDNISFLDDGVILQSGGVEVLTNPEHRRLKEFLGIWRNLD